MSRSGTRDSSRSSETLGVAETTPAPELETALTDTLAWLAHATRPDTAPVNLEAARGRLRARLVREALYRPCGTCGWWRRRLPVNRWAITGRPSGTMGNRPLPIKWPALTATAVILASALGFLAVRRLSSPAGPSARVQEVRFDLSLWELDRIADSPTGDATAELTGLSERGR